MHGRKAAALLVATLVASTTVAGCLRRDVEPGGESYSTADVAESASEGPLAVNLRVVELGALAGGGSNVTLEVTATRAVAEVAAGIAVGDGLRSSERAVYEGPVSPDRPVRLWTVIRAESPGAWGVRGFAQTWDDGVPTTATREVLLGGDGERWGRRTEGAVPVVASTATLVAEPGHAGATYLTGTFSVSEDSPTTTVVLTPGEGWRVTAGEEAIWRGAAEAGRTYTLEWTVRGTGEPAATMTVHPDPATGGRASQARIGPDA